MMNSASMSRYPICQPSSEVNLGGHLNKQTEAGLLTILALEEIAVKCFARG